MNRLLVLAASLSVLGAASAHAQTFPSATFDNSAKITQTGNNNEAEIDQAVGGIINGQGSAEIIQNGNRNDASITQTSATSPMSGRFANEATIDQRRNRGTASIDQIHDYATTRPNSATIVQITADAVAHIDQRGDRNTATIRQFNTSTLPVSNVEQNGNFNVTQVRQRGANGLVNVRQGTFVAGPGVSPQMDRGRVEVDNEGSGANIFVQQLGFGHTAYVFEDGTNADIDVDMNGSFNNANVLVESTNGTVRIVSSGSSALNFANVIQAGTDQNSVANIFQSGWNGTSDIEQLDSVGGGGSNFAESSQSGIGAGLNSIYSDILQNGGSNTAFVNQAAALANSAVLQTGTGHSANVSQ